MSYLKTENIIPTSRDRKRYYIYIWNYIYIYGTIYVIGSTARGRRNRSHFDLIFMTMLCNGSFFIVYICSTVELNAKP